jgi:3-dehydroquinate dehydratase-2
MRIAIINGPNLNLLGSRETSVYGDKSFDVFFEELKSLYSELTLEYHQSNHEGEIVEALQVCGKTCDGIVLNAAGYSHTSVAIADAVRAIDCPVVEVHISNIFAREPERHRSLLSASVNGMITGLGLKGYELAVEYLKSIV